MLRSIAALTVIAVVICGVALVFVSAQTPDSGGLSNIEQTATALVRELLASPTPVVIPGPPQPGPNSNTGADSPDLTPVFVVGAAFLVIIFAGALARMGSDMTEDRPDRF